MSVTDPLPDLVRDFVEHDEAPSARQLLAEVQRHVSHVTRSYPAAWFVLGRKEPESVADLGNRVFTTCARVEKGRFPFSGRTPFLAYVREQFDGRTIRYHSFYAKLSITRELMRDDYARNLVRNPVLRWRAELFREIGAVLRARAEAQAQGVGQPPRWRLREAGPQAVRPPHVVEERLRLAGTRDVAELVTLALQTGGPQTQSTLTRTLEAVLGTPAEPELDAPISAPPDNATALAVRRAVVEAWQALDQDERDLLVAVARGTPYDELVAAHPRFRHKVAITRAVTRVGHGFVARVVAAVSEQLPASGPAARPQELVEQVLEVLLEVLPELTTADQGVAR